MRWKYSTSGQGFYSLKLILRALSCSYMDTLKKQLAKAGRKVDYLIVSHTEPDHSGVLNSLQYQHTTNCPTEVLAPDI